MTLSEFRQLEQDVWTYEEEDVKAFIKEMEDYAYDEDFIKIKVKDVPEHMVGHDLTWLDKHLARIRTKYLNKLRKKAGDKLIKTSTNEGK